MLTYIGDDDIHWFVLLNVRPAPYMHLLVTRIRGEVYMPVLVFRAVRMQRTVPLIAFDSSFHALVLSVLCVYRAVFP